MTQPQSRIQEPIFPSLRQARRGMKAGAYAYYRLVQHITQLPKQFIIINAPARSGTSMLTCILCSHPEICGYGETKVIYESKKSIYDLVSQVCWAYRKLWVTERYFLDKVVYKQFIQDVSIFDGLDVRWIFLLRDPHATVKSFVHYFGKSEQRALTYYRNRLSQLQTQAKQLKDQRRSLFVTYEALTSQTEGSLAVITDFLGLDEPLRSSYRYSLASKGYGAGDQSEYITSGEVLSRPRSYRVTVSDNALVEATEVYAKCRDVLKDCCRVAKTV